MPWKGPLVTVEGARQIFSSVKFETEIRHDEALGIYECRSAGSKLLQARTLIALCQMVVEELASSSLSTQPSKIQQAK
ncbi:MAG: hypothetical protein AAF528_04125 [Cyanobacteria bacterium P01_C01_bin.121]